MLNIHRTLAVLLLLSAAPVWADEDAAFRQWAMEYEALVKTGGELFADPFFSENGKSCAECHAGAQGTNAATFPKYRKGQGKVVQLWETVNWCVEKALGKTPLKPDSREMTALVSYITEAGKGIPLKPGGH